MPTLDEYLKSARHVVHDEPDDRFMMHPEFLSGLDLLAGYGLA